MRVKSLIASAWIVLAALLGAGIAACAACAGCSSGAWEMQEYRPPALTAGQGAVLRGRDGVYVVGIDNQSVRTGTDVYSGMGGNEVLLAPGKHRVYVERALSDLKTSLKYSLSNKATFEHTFDAGHRYDLGYTIGFEMVDETTGQRIEPVP